MFGKSDRATFLQIVFHSKSAEGNAGDRLFRTNLPHQIVSTSVGQSDVAHEQIEFRFFRQLQRLLDRFGAGHFVAKVSQQSPQGDNRVSVIINQKNAERGFLLIT